MESNDIKSLTKRMGVIINLMMRDIKSDGKNITDADKIKSPINVSVVLAKLKKK